MKPHELAKATVEEYTKTNNIFTPPEALVGVSTKKAGTFVSIKTFDDELRGCIGTISPTKDTLAKEIISNAIKAATLDPRFEKVEISELDNLKYSVDVLFSPERVKNIKELNPKLYGIIVSSVSGNQALLLPNLDGIDSTEDQIAICKRKAGISHDESVIIQRFKVERYS